MNIRPWMAFVLVLLGSIGCARHVVRAPDHGVVAIPLDTNMWPLRFRDRAEELMSAHFPEGYVIEHEQEVVVGQTESVDVDEVSSTLYKKGPFSINSGTSNTTVTTSDETEWRIYYRRR